jgi:hypothetical protein
VASVVGYFVYIVTAFVAVMGLLIACFDRSTLEVRRYPSPAVEIVSANKAEDRRLTSGGEERFAKNLPGKQTKDGDVVALAKPKLDKINQHKRLAHVGMPKVFARLRENYDEHRFRFALGYAEGPGYRPGLDGQH